MSNRNKKRKKKQRLSQDRKIINEEKRRILKELKELKKDISVLELRLQEAKKEKAKQFHIRNLKVFVNTCNLVAPFVVCSGITVGLFALFGGGTPFHRDQITKYKTYNIEYQMDGTIEMEEEYKTDRWYDNALPSNSLTIYTPWSLQDDQYIRIKRTYNLGELTTLDLYYAVLEEDYDYINNNLDNYKEEKQIFNKLNITENNNYEMKASLHIIEKDNFLKYDETLTKNIIITVIELIVGLGFGGLITALRDFSFSYEVHINNVTYHNYIDVVENTQLVLDVHNKKLLKLTKYLGGKSYEK